MRKMRPAFLLLLFYLTSCGKFLDRFGREEKNDETKVSFSNGRQGQIGLLDSLNGGMMIYALGLDGAKVYRAWYFATEGAAMAGTPISLPNGTYRFLAFGYPTTAMSGNSRCGQASSGVVSLNGTATTVNISMNGGDCNDDYFRPNSSYYFDANQGMRGFQIVSCSSATNIDAFTTSSVCTGGAQKGNINHTYSVKISLVSGSAAGGEPLLAETSSGLSSACITGAGTPGSNPIPSFSANATAKSVFALSNSVILFGSSGASIKRSADGGVTFGTVGTMGSDVVNCVHGAGSLVFAATDANLYKSTDAGATWASVQSGNFDDVFVSGTKVLAGRASVNTVHYSTDATSFSTFSVTGMDTVTAVFIDESTGALYAGGVTSSTTSVLAKSLDGGTSWSTVHSGSSEGAITRIRIAEGKLFYSAEGGSGVFAVSSDSGASFTKYCFSACANTAVLPSNSVKNFEIVGKVYYVATSSGMGVSADAGASWITYGATELGVAGSVHDLTFTNGRLFFGLSYSDSYRVTDSRGSGAAFPSVSASLFPRIAQGGVNAGTKGFATRVDVYSDAVCSALTRTYYFPKGIANPPIGETSGFTAKMDNTATDGILFLRDL